MASLPSRAFCGESIEFSATVLSGATGSAHFRSIDTGEVVTVALSVSGTTATATYAPEKTANLPAGIYVVALTLEVAGIRSVESIGNLTLQAPPDRAPLPSHARKMVRALEAHLEGRISDDEGRGLETYTVGGVPITKISLMDARELLTKYRRDLDTEIAKARADAGLSNGRTIYSRFE
jgi:hypothetical protein